MTIGAAMEQERPHLLTLHPRLADPLRAPASRTCGPQKAGSPDARGAARGNQRLRRCLGFFASVIKSGEPWTETCQREYDEALSPQGAASLRTETTKRLPPPAQNI